jgi:hypothetical protein
MAPLVTTHGGITLKAYGFTKGSAGLVYRAFFIGLPGFADWNWNSDGLGNLYTGGLLQSTSTNILKIDAAAGTITWQKQDTSAQGRGTRNIAIESNTGRVTFGNNPPSNSGIHYVLNSGGNIEYQRNPNFGAVGAGINTYPKGFDSSANILGNIPSTLSQFYIFKFNTAGAIQWQRQLTRSGCDIYFQGGTIVDPAGAIYTSGGGLINALGQWFTFVVKYNTAGAIQWQQTLSGVNFVTKAIYSTGSGNLAVVSNQYNTDSRWVTSLFNPSTGAVIWQRELTGVSGIVARGVATDSDGNVYSIGRVGVTELYIAKYNSSGVLQWQRRITMSGGGMFRPDEATIFVTDNLDFYIGFNHEVGSYCLRLPQDGSLTGTYVLGGRTVTYAAVTSLTDNAFTTSWSGGVMTDATPSQSFNTPTRTFTDSTYTLSRI